MAQRRLRGGGRADRTGAPQKTAVSREVATQSGYSMVGLLRLYHDYVLYKTTAPAEPVTASQKCVAVRIGHTVAGLLTEQR